MRSLQKTRRIPLALLLVVALAFGPIGCGCECAAPGLLEFAGVTAAVFGTANHIKQMEAARLEAEVNRLRLKSLQEALGDDDGDDAFRISRRTRTTRPAIRQTGGLHVPGLN
jgi:hypothetical protein